MNNRNILESKRRIIDISIALFILFISIYSLTYSGTYVTDDEHILSSRSLSFALDEGANDFRVLGNNRVFELSQLSSDAVNIEPAQTIIGSILVRLAVSLNTGRVQTLFLMNIWVTAASAVIIFITLIITGYTKITSLVLSLFIGFGSIVWPYSRTYFRDPLAMFFLSTAWMFLELLLTNSIEPHPKWKSIFYWIALFAFLSAGILSKNTIVIAIPVFFLKLFSHYFREYRINNFNNRKIFSQFWIPSTTFIVILLIWIFYFPSNELLGRFTYSYYSYLFKFFTTTAHPGILEALIGPIISPGKSVFIFSPILVISLIGLFFRWKAAWPGWMYFFLLVVGQALFYDSLWTGLVNWGLRFTLPAIPLLVIGAAPIVESLLKSIYGKVSLIFLAVISVFIQMSGVLPPIEKYYIDLASASSAVTSYSSIWVFNQTNLLWSIKWLLSGGEWNIAICRNLQSSGWAITGSTIAILLAYLNIKKSRPLWLIFATIIFILLTSTILFNYKYDAPWNYARKDLQSTMAKIENNYQPGNLVLLKAYGTPAWDYWMNWGSKDIQWAALPFFFPPPEVVEEFNQSKNPDKALDENTLNIFEEEVLPGRKVWLVLPSDSPGTYLGIEQKWLEDRSVTYQCWDNQGDLEVTKLCEYAIK